MTLHFQVSKGSKLVLNKWVEANAVDIDDKSVCIDGTEYPRNYNNEHISFLSIDGMIEIIDVEGDEE